MRIPRVPGKGKTSRIRPDRKSSTKLALNQRASAGNLCGEMVLNGRETVACTSYSRRLAILNANNGMQYDRERAKLLLARAREVWPLHWS